ncbi:MAG: sugar ABC transporter ATP-binding protein [Methanomassiliicoccales archaeon]|nr:sugar ABC transporter ATP-binding protein [Methanomassiliicoccales archaeon]
MVTKIANNVLVYMENISKSFGPVRALKGVDFFVKHSEIVGLLGDNGAGKSTLIKILTGVIPPDTGSIYFEGKKINFNSPAEARRMGIETVYQEAGVVELLSVARNFFLGREIVRKLGFLDYRRMYIECEKVLRNIGVQIHSPNMPAGVLSGGERQAINIGRAMYFKAKLLVLDEPTTALSVKETERILDFIQQVRDRTGVSIIFVTHNISHVYRVADRFVILDRGRKIADMFKNEVTEKDIIEYLTEKTLRQ